MKNSTKIVQKMIIKKYLYQNATFLIFLHYNIVLNHLESGFLLSIDNEGYFYARE